MIIFFAAGAKSTEFPPFPLAQRRRQEIQKTSREDMISTISTVPQINYRKESRVQKIHINLFIFFAEGPKINLVAFNTYSGSGPHKKKDAAAIVF